MNFRPLHALALMMAAAMPLAAWSAEPAQSDKVKQLYLDFAQAPASGPDNSLQASVDRLKAQRVQRAAIPAAATSQAATDLAMPLASQPARDALTAETLDTLKRIPPSQQKNLLAAADGVFNDGHLPHARAMYEAVLAQNPPAPTRAWVLYQLGNCVRAADPRSAMALYNQVVKEHGDCPWAQAAQASAKLLEWKQASAVQELVDSSGRISLQLTSRPAAPASKPADETAASGGAGDE
ncbi:MAG: hypothetical protein LLG01_07865 [Planctomycetaceae bacterium]|nr:hypothetical protein [Planctomycetaceae bacterium]